MAYRLRQTDLETQAALDKIEELGLATITEAGLMSPDDKAKLDAMGISIRTTAEWDAATGYIPMKGEIVIYSDYRTITRDNSTVYVPGIKIGSGNGYVQDLAFIDDALADALTTHTSNTTVHITAEERTKWNNKLSIDDTAEVVNETLILGRN